MVRLSGLPSNTHVRNYFIYNFPLFLLFCYNLEIYNKKQRQKHVFLVDFCLVIDVGCIIVMGKCVIKYYILTIVALKGSLTKQITFFKKKTL